MLIPTRKNTSSGRLAPSPFELGSASASVDGAVVRGVAVAPRIPPDPLGDAPGVPLEDGAALGDELEAELGDALGEELGDALGEELGDALGEELGDALGLADGVGLGVGQAGTVTLSITNPSENVIR
jgi:hypothetical protein